MIRNKKKGTPIPTLKGLQKELKGFDEKELEPLYEKYGKTKINTDIRQKFGKVSRYNIEYTKSVKMIELYTELRDKYEKKIKDIEKSYLSMVKYIKPKITLNRPTKSYPFWRGKVWWGVSVKKFGKKSGWKRFHIVSDKKVKKLNLSEEQIRQMGREKFVKDMVDKDLILKSV